MLGWGGDGEGGREEDREGERDRESKRERGKFAHK